MLDGPQGYPDEEDFAYIAAEAGFSIALVQDTIPKPLIYGAELGLVMLTMRRLYLEDGAGGKQPHYDVVSSDDVLYPSYEEIGMWELDMYTDFL